MAYLSEKRGNALKGTDSELGHGSTQSSMVGLYPYRRDSWEQRHELLPREHLVLDGLRSFLDCDGGRDDFGLDLRLKIRNGNPGLVLLRGLHELMT